MKKMINKSKMNSVLNYVFKNAKQDDTQSVVNKIDSFVSDTGTCLMHVVREK